MCCNKGSIGLSGFGERLGIVDCYWRWFFCIWRWCRTALRGFLWVAISLRRVFEVLIASEGFGVVL